jgi:hypothetical protein
MNLNEAQEEAAKRGDTLLQRVLAKAEERDAGGDGPCWQWTGGRRSNSGAPLLSIWNSGKMRNLSPRRVAYTLVDDPGPVALVSRCKNLNCIRPEHAVLSVHRKGGRPAAAGTAVQKNAARGFDVRAFAGDDLPTTTAKDLVLVLSPRHASR